MKSFSHTLSVRRNGNQHVLRSCSFESSPRETGAHWDVHKGVIPDQQSQKVVVKVPKDLQSPSTQVAAELDKFNFTKSVLQQCSSAAKHVKLVPTYHSEIDKVGRLCKLQKRKNGNRFNGNLREGTKVVVQEHREGDIQCLLDIGRSKTQSHHPDTQASLLTLVHHSYAFSRGQCVIAGVKGVKVCDDKGRVTYHVTSLTIHSREKKYGEKDEGVEGMALYKAWSGLHHRVQPTAPPPPPKVSDTKGLGQFFDTSNTGRTDSSDSCPSTAKFQGLPVYESESSIIPLSLYPASHISQALGSVCCWYRDLLDKASKVWNMVCSKNGLASVLGLQGPRDFSS